MDYLEGIQKNFDEAAKVLKLNCEEHKHSNSCYKLGTYYVTGKGKEGLLSLVFVIDSSAELILSLLCRRALMGFGEAHCRKMWKGVQQSGEGKIITAF